MIELNMNHLASESVKKIDDNFDSGSELLQKVLEKDCLGSEFLGWLNWPAEKGFDQLKTIEIWKDSLEIYYDVVVLCGIGGSFAGVKAVDQALSPSFRMDATNRKQKIEIIYVGHHLNEEYYKELMDYLSQKKPLCVIASKSGTTTEPGIGFRVLRNFLAQNFTEEEARQRIVAVTDAKKGSLKEFCEDKGIKSFSLPSDVGGRYSVLTAIGLVPLCLAGYKCKELLEGANAFFASLETLDSPIAKTVINYANARNFSHFSGKSIDLFSYAQPKLAGFVEWWKQLFGESEGKNDKGLFPSSMIYSTDLHSLGQYLQEGKNQFLETFFFVQQESASENSHVESRMRIPRGEGRDGLDYLEGRFIDDVNKAAMQAGLEAHSERGVHCLSLTIPKIDLYHLGFLFGFFQVSCALSGLLIEVNPFDQPGVENYKTKLFSMMGRPGYES